ncbi:C10 family peptidase [Odoribacter sp. OttesenSCG-928-L07]|nr:C10 family peptidase [Odoribacter sp. OttesenSCG-928-L07]
MKLKHFTLMLLLISSIFYSASAKSVDEATAKIVAKNCFYEYMNKFETAIDFNSVSIKSIELKVWNETPVMYVVHFIDGGFVLVSAQESMPPILGYSTESGSVFDYENGAPAFKYFIEDLMRSVEYATTNNIQRDEATAYAWSVYVTDNYESLLASKDDVEVGPLLATEWNQDYPYNYYAPLDASGPGGRCYAGCVATAMSVVMHHFEWPPQGIGYSAYNCTGYGPQYGYYSDSTYNWSTMPIKLTSSSTEESILASALIQYHAGVAVRMMYSPDGSGAYSNDVPYAMINHFDYPTTTFTQKQYTPNWENLLIEQLDLGYPLYHNGQSPTEGGHAWNCDGYRIVSGVTTFHHNFNWGGSGNGWFSSANPGGSGSGSGFSNAQGIMKNCYPNASNYPPYVSGHTTLTTKFGRVRDGSGPLKNYLSNTDASWLISPQGEYDSIVSIDLSWEQFDLAQGDYVKVYDGGSESAELIGEYTGSTLPESIKSSGNQLYITFKTTGSAPGFIFTYKANRVVYCSGLANVNQASYSVITNPDDKNYNPNTLCRWNIVYSQSTGGKLTVHYIDTYDENDYLMIYDLGTNEVYTLFGQLEDQVFEISNGGCMITFKTDNMNTSGIGASFTYEDYYVGINDVKIGELEIYPNPANDKINIRLENKDSQTVSYQITNMIGSVVMRNSYSHNQVSNHTIDVSSLNSGVYIITLKTNQGTESRKIIIN